MSKMKQDYSILIGGEAGQGSMMAGQIIAKLFSELGYNIFIYNDYQSLIRGGHNFSQIRASKEKILTHREKSDFILALDKNTFEKHKGNLNKGGIIIYDSGSFSLKDKKAIGISLNKIVSGLGGIPIMNNVALVGGFAKIIGIEWGTVRKVLSRKFKKYQEINLKVAKVAYNQTENLIKVRKLSEKSQPLLTGNEALALGTVKAGLSLYIAYPMTPSTGILHYLVNHQKDLGISVSHLENELGVINAAVGSAYTGARTMVGSSGGGFALMTEALSLAVQNETPLVIVESQRMAPGSGVPTYTAQSDLLFALSAGHGDIVKFVIAPGDAEEACF
jgi:2-oxoglutarate/2-oxoacid ferredoxin oxidoreductase subunit alpha